MAISFLGSSPRVGRPTRRMRESCLSERSGISEKSIFFDFVDFSFFPARPPRADNPRDLFIAFAPCRVSYNEHSPQTAQGHAQAARLGERVLQNPRRPDHRDREKPWPLLRTRRRARARWLWPSERPHSNI